MKKLLFVLLAALILSTLSIIMIGCAQSTKSPPTITIDTPYLTANEAITIAKQYSLRTSSTSLAENKAAYYAKIGKIENWSASHQGNGKWEVILLAGC
jgi:hypothetical protein